MNKLFDHEGRVIQPPHPHEHLMTLEDAFRVMPVSLASSTIQAALAAAYGEEQARIIIRSML